MMTTTTPELTKTQRRRIISRLTRHDSSVSKTLYLGAVSDGTQWIASPYWAVPLADWPWAGIVRDGLGTYVLAANDISQVSEDYPAFDSLFAANWPHGQVTALPVTVDNVAAYTTNSAPLLRLGSAIIAVDLDLVGDMLAIEDSSDAIMYPDIDGQTVVPCEPRVRFTGRADQPFRPLTVWQMKDGIWSTVGLLMPIKAA